MDNKDLPAMPLTQESSRALNEGYDYGGFGLTKREYFAAQALRALAHNDDPSITSKASRAVRLADELLKYLEE